MARTKNTARKTPPTTGPVLVPAGLVSYQPPQTLAQEEEDDATFSPTPSLAQEALRKKLIGQGRAPAATVLRPTPAASAVWPQPELAGQAAPGAPVPMAELVAQ